MNKKTSGFIFYCGSRSKFNGLWMAFAVKVFDSIVQSIAAMKHIGEKGTVHCKFG